MGRSYNAPGKICPCNRGLGQLGDSLENLERAVTYLKEFG